MPIRKKVKFAFKAPEGTKEVKLCADFTNWENGAIVMKNGRSGEWTTSVPLDSGEYQYKFMVDGAWQRDPAALSQAQNSFGSENSVKIV